MTDTARGFTEQPPNTLPAIKEVWVFASVDTDGNEGVCGAKFGDTFMPLVAADAARLRGFYPIAQQIAKLTGRHVRMVRLSVREVVVDDVLQEPLPAELRG